MKRMLKDFDMMKNFMILGYLPQDMEPEEESGKGDAMPFPGSDNRSEFQSQGPVPEACSSCRHYRMRPAITKTS
jgi:hypothetical protein